MWSEPVPPSFEVHQYHPPFPWQEDWQPCFISSCDASPFPRRTGRFLPNIQPLKMRRALETGNSKLFTETPGREGILLHLSCWLTLLGHTGKSINLFTPLPQNFFKCPRHLMSTHNYSRLPREVSSSSYFGLCRQLSLVLLPRLQEGHALQEAPVA